MKTLNLLKIISSAAILVCLNVPNAMAGATNRDENKAATPGDKSATVKTPADGDSNSRKGTTKTNEMNTPQRSGNTSSGSGSSSGNSSSGSSGSGSSSSGNSSSSGSSGSY